ncbi:MAG: radical SAM protein [Thermoguttaceae bacterium]
MAKVLFLQNISYDYVGTMMLSAELKQAGHQCLVKTGHTISAFRAIIEQERPDIIGFSLMSGLHLWANDITAQIRAMNLPYRPFIIYGGPHPTFFPDILTKSQADAVCIGEGDGAIVDLANCIANGGDPTTIANLHVKKGAEIVRNPVRPLVELDSLPFADRTVYYGDRFFRDSPTKQFAAGRGCPYNCTFCYNKRIRDVYEKKGTFVRLRSPENVVAEIAEVRRKWGMRTVMFLDDTFGLQKPWLLALAERYKKEVGLPFMCKIRANTVDEEMVAALKDAGCYAVCFAIETANEDLRERVLRKRVTDDNIRGTAKLLRKHKVKFLTYNMVGIPTQTTQDILDTIDLNVEIGTSYPWCSIFSPYPGTELGEFCIQEGYLDRSFNPDDLSTSFHSTVPIATKDAKTINNLHKLFQLAVLVPWLRPLVKKLAKFPPNPCFTLIFAFVYFVNYVRSERLSFFRTVRLALDNAKEMLGSKRG